MQALLAFRQGSSLFHKTIVHITQDLVALAHKHEKHSHRLWPCEDQNFLPYFQTPLEAVPPMYELKVTAALILLRRSFRHFIPLPFQPHSSFKNRFLHKSKVWIFKAFSALLSILFSKNYFYSCSITVVCIFPPPLPSTPAIS